MVNKYLGIFLFFLISLVNSIANDFDSHVFNSTYLDSLDQRIAALRNELPRLKKTRDPKYLIVKQKLDKAIFVRTFEAYVIEEEIENAKELTELRIMRANLKRDEKALEFYYLYLQRANSLLKQQKSKYQKLFAKEKNFKREFNKLMSAETLESYEKALSMTNRALKYAAEKGLLEAVEFLEKYKGFVTSAIFDLKSDYDLSKLTRSEKYFFEEFMPLIDSDSIELIKEAEQLVDHSYNYAANTKSLLDTNFFIKQKRVVVTATSDYYTRLGNNLSEIASQIVEGSLTSPNPEGVYKWGKYVLVIDTFTVNATFDNVNRGTAVLIADKRLVEYIRVNDLADINRRFKVGKAFVLPFVINGSKRDFYYNPLSNSWQFMVCYTLVENQRYMKQISQYMKPISFDETLKSEVSAQFEVN
jgi:hypothetical protein